MIVVKNGVHGKGIVPIIDFHDHWCISAYRVSSKLACQGSCMYQAPEAAIAVQACQSRISSQIAVEILENLPCTILETKSHSGIN